MTSFTRCVLSAKDQKSVEDFASQVLEIALQYGHAYLWRFKNQLRAFPYADSNTKVDGILLRAHIKKSNAEFLGKYTPAARGADILDDVKFEVEQLK